MFGEGDHYGSRESRACLERVYKTGDVETSALKDVSISIEAGEFAALVGPSGSGKTTLLQLIGCLDTPSSGKVIIAGQDVSKLNRDQRADTPPGQDRLRLSVLRPHPDLDRL